MEKLGFDANSFKTLLDFLGKAIDVAVGGVEDAVDMILVKRTSQSMYSMMLVLTCELWEPLLYDLSV